MTAVSYTHIDVYKRQGFTSAQQTTLPQEMIDTIESCGFFESIPSVSYTHLDVYKRQPKGSEKPIRTYRLGEEYTKEKILERLIRWV